MLALTNEELIKNIDLHEFKQYMLYELNYKENVVPLDNSTTNSTANSTTNSTTNSNALVSTANVPRSQIQIKYTKKFSKYYEPIKINNSKNFADK
jgi:hypothetical protein